MWARPISDLMSITPFVRTTRYTHRVGISNQRLQAIDVNGVRFATKGGRSLTLPPQTFIRRFLLHVLPAGFVKIRHYGLLACWQRDHPARPRACVVAGERHA